MQKWYELWFQKTLFLSEHADSCVFVIGQKLYLQLLRTTSLAMTSQQRHSIS